VGRSNNRGFLSPPPASRLACIVIVGVFLGARAHKYKVSRRPRELSRAGSEVGWDRVGKVIDRVAESGFGGTPRGRLLTRDGETIWVWVQREYADCVSDPHYEPVGYSREELAERTGISCP